MSSIGRRKIHTAEDVLETNHQQKATNDVLLILAVLALPTAGWAEDAKDIMTLTSSSFEDGGKIPARHTRDRGQRDLSPPLAWKGVPAETKSFALLCIDQNPVAHKWVHWVVFDVPAASRSLAEGLARTSRLSDGTRQGRGGFGQIGWGGPQPPPGTGNHDYGFTLYALDVAKLDLPATPSAEQLKAAINGHVLAEATLTGVYAH